MTFAHYLLIGMGVFALLALVFVAISGKAEGNALRDLARRRDEIRKEVERIEAERDARHAARGS